jgi:oligopeptide/dipeptide ABC transporter ATP-binding protein
MSPPLLDIQDLRVWFSIRKGILNRVVGQIRAVDGVSLCLSKGETLGLVGESGCGKTTLGRAILGLEQPHSGSICFAGQQLRGLGAKERRLLRRRCQMIFQDPYSSLNPRMTAMDIITEGMAHHRLLAGRSREEAAAELMGEVGLDRDGIFRYPHEFSGGQRQRLSIARALSLQAELIVCDEPVSALDVSVQAQVINLLMDLRAKHQLSYLFISHDLSVVRLIAQRVAVMYLGRIIESGPCSELLDAPLHPYSQALISAVPTPGQDTGRRIILKGEMPSPAAPPPGCPFHPRCPQAMPICGRLMPAESQQGQRSVRCHLYKPENA